MLKTIWILNDDYLSAVNGTQLHRCCNSISVKHARALFALRLIHDDSILCRWSHLYSHNQTMIFFYMITSSKLWYFHLLKAMKCKLLLRALSTIYYFIGIKFCGSLIWRLIFGETISHVVLFSRFQQPQHVPYIDSPPVL